MLDILIFLIIGLAVLIKASEYVIGSSLEISKILRISQFAVGFIVVSVATSLPELMVSIFSALSGNPAIAVGNVIGANIADMAWVFGVTAVLGAALFTKKSVIEDARILLFISIVPLILIIRGTIDRLDGIILLVIFAMYCFHVKRSGNRVTKEMEVKYGGVKTFKTSLVFFASIVALLIAAAFVVQNAVALANVLNLPQSFIGLSIVSVGTTLPELTVNIGAVRRKKNSLAIGNILGSCVANLTMVLGTAAVITPIQIKSLVPLSSILFLIGVNLFVFLQLRRRAISRTQGAAMIVAYFLFIVAGAGLLTLWPN